MKPDKDFFLIITKIIMRNPVEILTSKNKKEFPFYYLII